jgi:hypothetical protein
MKNKITTGFESLTDPGFETKASDICASMSSNPNFATTIPALTDVTSQLQAYSAGLTAAQSKDRNAVATKNQLRENLTDLLTQLGSYVMAVANGDKAKLISSGFDLAKEGESTPLSKPDNIQLTDGKNAGELIVKVTAVKGAKSYVHQYTSDPLTPNSDWAQVITTTSKYTIKNLSSAQKYWCRVAAVGSLNQVVYSDAVSRIAQ